MNQYLLKLSKLINNLFVFTLKLVLKFLAKNYNNI